MAFRAAPLESPADRVKEFGPSFENARHGGRTLRSAPAIRKQPPYLELVSLPLLLLILACAPAAALEDSRSWREVKAFAAGGGPRVVVVDNYRGPITVAAARGDAVEAVIGETVTGRTREDIAAAREQVKLDVTQEGNRVRFVVDGPFRDDCRDGRRSFNSQRDKDRVGERVTYAFELRVPAGTELELDTVIGDVRVDGADGRFAVSSVNGGVEMTGVRGAGSARSVNGPVRVVFAANPDAECRFETVNGEVDVAFRPGFAADLRFKTMNGEVFSDFPYVRKSLAAPSGDRRKGRFVLQQDGAFGITIGGGGPELAFTTINGNILVRNQDR